MFTLRDIARLLATAAVLGLFFAATAFAEEGEEGTGVRSETAETTKTRVAFRPLDVWLDSGAEALAAYQVEVVYDRAHVKIVGLEGGEPGGFNPAPYYDPAGLEAGRIVIAAFVTEDADDADAPRGRARVARLHLRVEGEGDPDVSIRLVTAASPGGGRIEPRVEILDMVRDNTEGSRT